ncbi:MAG: serine/threonine protein kinase [Planctomycetota bacterium]|jgi:serine/threonine protein kinase
MVNSHIDAHSDDTPNKAGGPGDVTALSGSSNAPANDEDLVADLRAAFDVNAEGTSAEQLESLAFLKVNDSRADLPSCRDALAAGSVLADFEIVREIGRGGMGVVYQARQLSLNRDVALKVLPDYGRHGRTAVRRFRNEALAAARLNHTNVVPVYAQGEFEGHYYYAMKLIHGVSLDRVIRTHPELLSSTHADRSGGTGIEPIEIPEFNGFDEAQSDADNETSGSSLCDIKRNEDDFRYLASLMVGVADGLAHAHANGVIHRDIKPHNLMLGPERKLHITDFGLAHLTSEPHITVTGEVMGTPLYLAPEQARGEVSEIGEHTDIYAMGVTLYELATGERPFDAENREKVLEAVRHFTPKRPRAANARIPVDLETIILRAMEKRASDRYASAGQLVDDLRRFSEDRPILSRRTTLLERGIKWVRRHKAVSYAAAVTIALATVSSAFALAGARWRHQEAMASAESVYERLVFNNYRQHDAVAEELREALEAGAEGGVADLAAAMYELANERQAPAIELLSQLLEDDPGNRDALYMLAWAYSRPPTDENALAQVLARGQAMGGPRSAASWFLYGLAIHFDDPDRAITAYRTAATLRSAESDFFPQANLHLARANNQRMYRTRTLDGFAEATSSFQKLISEQYYEDYPYYLLTLTNLMAGQIHERTHGIRDPEGAAKYFDKALDTASECRQKYPDKTRVLSAEAEVLEHIGDYETAMEVRAQARGKGSPLKVCEESHFRWRLAHWMGATETALEGIDEVLCLDNDDFYRHVYRGVLLAESGNIDGALAVVDSIMADKSLQSERPLLAAIYLYLLGRKADAEAVMQEMLQSILQGEFDSDRGLWLQSMCQFSTGSLDFDILIRATETDLPQEQRNRRAEAWFLAGARALASGDRDEAMAGFENAYLVFAGVTGYSFRGRWMQRKLQLDPDWPQWLDTGAPDLRD